MPHSTEPPNRIESPALRAAFGVPLMYSDDLEGPLHDLHLTHLDDEALIDFFAGRTLDIGSGVEGFARGLQARAAKLGRSVAVISLNPQFVNWRRGSENEVVYQRTGIRKRISEEIFGLEYLDEYRAAMAGLVQFLPVRDESCETVVSTWAFPTVFQQYNSNLTQLRAGFGEILRVLKPGGKALLGPVQGQKRALEIEQLLGSDQYSNHQFTHLWQSGSAIFHDMSLRLDKK